MISIVICTHNRAFLLGKTLDSFRQLQPNAQGFELVVVDNASVDDTREVVDRFAAASSLHVHYVREDKLGHSHALNAGITNARGSIIAFTDDDAYPRTDWLIRIDEAFSAHEADVVFGKILPVWEHARPRWFSEKRFPGHFALLDYGDQAFVVTNSNQPFFGVNHAVRVDVFERFGGYRTDRGGIGTKGGQGNDIDLFKRCLSGGARIVYDPDVVVGHFIPEQRSTKAGQRKGLSQTYEMVYRSLLEEQSHCPWFWGLPRWLYREAANHFAGLLWNLAKLNEREAFFHELRLRRIMGLWRLGQTLPKSKVCEPTKGLLGSSDQALPRCEVNESVR